MLLWAVGRHEFLCDKRNVASEMYQVTAALLLCVKLHMYHDLANLHLPPPTPLPLPP